MDVTECDTNVLLLNNISSIAYHVYEPVVSQASVYSSKAFEVESHLRADGKLVYGDIARRGIWCFEVVCKDGSNGAPIQPSPESALESGSYTLKCVEDGLLEPASLVKSRAAGSTLASTPNSSSPSSTALENGSSASQASGASQAAAHGGSETEQKTATENKGLSATQAKEIYKYFISAVLSSLTSAFCSHTGAIMLSPRSLLLPNASITGTNDENPSESSLGILASFRIYLTTTGSLVISLSHTLVGGLLCASRSLPMSNVHSSTPVLAAPLGTFASYYALEHDLSSLDLNSIQSPDHQAVRRKPESIGRQNQWCDRFAKLLQARGLSSALLDGATWMCLRRQTRSQKVDDKHTPVDSTSSTILWPSTLCFWRACKAAGHGRSLSCRGIGCNFDPLLGGKRWFTSTDERDEALTKRNLDRERAASRQTGFEHHTQQPDGLSPIGLRRASNTGPAVPAAGAMYPTPPDGIQNALGVTPSFEGTVSSPSNAVATATAAADHDVVMSHTATASDMFGAGWDASEPKRGRHSASFTGDSADNMFEDIGEDMFADNDITDADFNFFDEQPGGPDIDFPMPDIASALDDPQIGSLAAVQQSQAPHGATNSSRPTEIQDAVFAKPELKHARSSLQDDLRLKSAQSEELASVAASGIKRHPSPFGPDTVFKRIRAALDSPAKPTVSGIKTNRRNSIFESVDFNSFLVLNNKKYQENGRFDCHWEPTQSSEIEPLAQAPTTDYLRRHKGVVSNLKMPTSTIGALVAKGRLENGTVSGTGDSDADDDSVVSELDDMPHSYQEATSPSKSSVARKRLDDDTVSIAASFKELEAVSASPQPSDLSRFLSNDGTELPLSRFFAEPDLCPDQHSYPDDEYMTIAQILTEQAASGTLQILSTDVHSSELYAARRRLASCARSSLQTVRSVLPQALHGAKDCSLRPLADVQDLSVIPQPTRLHPRNPAGTEQTRPSVFQIPSPHIEIRRHETKLSLVPSSISFWEVLGLGPSQGSKDVHSACLFPDHEGMLDAVDSFLVQTRIVYEALKLGSFARLSDTASVTNGLLSYDVERHAPTPGSAASSDTPPVVERMTQLCQALAKQSVNSKNFVVFFVYLIDDPRSMVECCAAFHRLFEMFRKKLADRRTVSTNELVMQLVPLDSVASPASPVILKHADYIKLCLETYDRCTLFGGPMPAPAVCLEQLPPRMIDFKLATSPSSNLLQENSCIHLAYAQSVDGRWVTAAWTDNRGSKQMTASYCRGRRGKALATSMADIAHEIWDTTHDLISMYKVHWRLIITKCGPMEREEIDYWIELAKAETKASITLTLLTVDTEPSLQLLPPTIKMPGSAPSVFYTTPVSTPQASIVSPEQSGNPPTPSMAAATSVTATTPGGGDATAENDGDTTLVDVTESTWGAVLSHRLHNTCALGEINPALISGYLVKRGGTRPEDPPVVMEVNMVHAEHSPRVYETLLREMLLYFRGLSTLARARHMVDPHTDVRPWHIAAAEKAVRVLSQLM